MTPVLLITTQRVCRAICVVSVTVVVSTIIGRALAGRELTSVGTHASSAEGLQVGDRISISGIDHTGKLPTVLIAVSRKCLWDQGQADVFRTLQRYDGRRFQFVAIASSVDQGAEAFAAMELPKPEIRQANLDVLNIRSTPSVFLLDPRGVVRGAWRGLHSSTQRQDLLRRLLGSERVSGATDERKLVNKVITPQDLKYVVAATGYPVLDIRPRLAFDQAHVAGALNVPLDELSTRARHELPVDGTVAMMCGRCPSCQEGVAEERLRSICVVGFQKLRNIGFKDVRVVMADPADLQSVGFTITQTPDLARATGGSSH